MGHPRAPGLSSFQLYDRTAPPPAYRLALASLAPQRSDCPCPAPAPRAEIPGEHHLMWLVCLKSTTAAICDGLYLCCCCVQHPARGNRASSGQGCKMRQFKRGEKRLEGLHGLALLETWLGPQGREDTGAGKLVDQPGSSPEPSIRTGEKG